MCLVHGNGHVVFNGTVITFEVKKEHTVLYSSDQKSLVNIVVAAVDALLESWYVKFTPKIYVDIAEMKTGEIILFSTVAALAAALVLTAKVVDDDISPSPRPPIVIEEVVD